MRILKVGLRNVKSYGDEAVEIPLANGVNFLSGKNGSGKSTLIETIGYALFDVLPYTKQDFVRRGAKTGMVTVWIEDQGELFRIERKFGSGNSWVVYDKDDVAFCEKSDDVLRFLCDRFHVPDPEQLQGMFRQIIGVRQGTFTTLFTMTPGPRKAIFDRIINVHLYRERAEQRGAVKNRMVPDEIHALEKKIEGAKAYIEDHKEDPVRLAQTESRLKIAEGLAKQVSARKVALQREKKALEDLKAQIDALDRQLATAESAITEGQKALKQAQAEVERCKAAVETCARTKAGYDAWCAAEAQREALEKKRTQRDELVRKTHELEKRVQSEAAALDELAADLAKRRETERSDLNQCGEMEGAWQKADKEAGAAEKESATVQKAYDAMESAFEADRKAEADFLERLGKARASSEQISEALEQVAKLQKSLSSFAEVEKLAGEAEGARRAERSLGSQLAGREAEVKEQEANKKELASLVCPFIKEHCDRVKPSVFQSKIADLRSVIKEIEQKLEIVGKSVQAASEAERKLEGLRGKKEQLSEARRLIRREWAKARKSLSEWKPFWGKYPEFPAEGEEKLDISPFESYGKDSQAEMNGRGSKLKAEERRNKQAAVAAASKRRQADAALQKLEEARGRLKKLRDEIAEKERKQAQRAGALEEARKKAAALADQLAGYSSLDADFAKVRARQDTHRAAHQEYVQNEQSASDLENRKGDVEKREKALTRARAEREGLMARRDKLAEGYDAGQAARVSAEHEKAVAQLAAAEEEAKNLVKGKTELTSAVAKLREHEAGVARWTLEGDKLKRFLALIEDLWQILRALGPRVSQRLLGMISARANRIFGVLHDQPGQLVWDEGYEVRLKQGNTDYPFGNLSGGEQMSAALSIQMAMARYFVGSSFCIFDEPTIHLDEARRQRLASTVREAQVDAGFTQVFIVSHDDTFGPYVDHEIKLAKSGERGTVIVS